MLLTADLQLDDNPENEYRWKGLTDIVNHVQFGTSVGILGDMTDNSNRFTNYFVNRVVDALLAIRDCGVQVNIIMGNHDAPKEGPPFWSFLNSITGIRYFTEPTFTNENRLWLPWAKEPNTAWAEIPWDRASVCFLHQLVNGARTKSFTMEAPSLPLPKNILYYAGDVHTPQETGLVTYVGAPTPTDFGDDYQTRYLVIDDTTYEIRREINVESIKKHSIKIESLEDLRSLKVNPGDKIKVDMRINAADITKAAQLEAEMQKWADENNVVLQGSFTPVLGERTETEEEMGSSPEDVLKAFAKKQGIPQELLDIGLEIVRGNK
jgi:DNA repair exonuclease SbcCD nuclease subunit